MHIAVVIKMNNIRVLLPCLQKNGSSTCMRRWAVIPTSVFIHYCHFSGIWNSNHKFYISWVYNKRKIKLPIGCCWCTWKWVHLAQEKMLFPLLSNVFGPTVSEGGTLACWRGEIKSLAMNWSSRRPSLHTTLQWGNQWQNCSTLLQTDPSILMFPAMTGWFHQWASAIINHYLISDLCLVLGGKFGKSIIMMWFNKIVDVCLENM